MFPTNSPSSRDDSPATASHEWTMCCNKCSKQLSSTIFVLSCDCVFCKDCTASHFETSSECPSCYKTIDAGDILELVVANPNANVSYDSLQRAFQLVFTKISPDANGPQSLQDACDRMLQYIDSNDRLIRFVLKQLIDASRGNDQHSVELVQAMELAQAERAELQQAITKQKLDSGHTIENLQREIQALEMVDRDQQTNIRELDIQLRQLEDLGANDFCSVGSRGSQGATSVPPMRGFTFQEQNSSRSPCHAVAATDRSPYQENSHSPHGSSNSGKCRTNIPNAHGRSSTRSSPRPHPSPYQEYPRSPHGPGPSVQQYPLRSNTPYPARRRNSSTQERSLDHSIPATARSPYQEYPRSPHGPGHYGNRPNSPYLSRPTISNRGYSSPGPGYEISFSNDAPLRSNSFGAYHPSSSSGGGRPNTSNLHYRHHL